MCKKSTGETANGHPLAVSDEDTSSSETRSASNIGENDFLRAQLEAVRENGLCTMQMVKSLVELVTVLSSEVQQLRIDNDTLKLQIRDLKQVPSTQSPMPSMATGAPVSYRDVLASANGHPVTTKLNVQPSVPAVASSTQGHPRPSKQRLLPEPAIDTQQVDGFRTVKGKRMNGNQPPSSGMPNPPARSRALLFGNKNGSSLETVPKKVRTRALFVSRFSPQVSSADVEKSLKDQLQLTSLKCSKLKTKYDSYSSFHISVSVDDFELINNANVWPAGCLIAPFYGRLNPDQIYPAETSPASRPPSPTTSVPTPDSESVCINTDGAPAEGIDALVNG
jgi:hypothetical protein